MSATTGEGVLPGSSGHREGCPGFAIIGKRTLGGRNIGKRDRSIFEVAGTYVPGRRFPGPANAGLIQTRRELEAARKRPDKNRAIGNSASGANPDSLQSGEQTGKDFGVTTQIFQTTIFVRLMGNLIDP